MSNAYKTLKVVETGNQVLDEKNWVKKVYKGLDADWSGHTKLEQYNEMRILAGITGRDVGRYLGERPESFVVWANKLTEESITSGTAKEKFDKMWEYVSMEYELTRYIRTNSSTYDPMYDEVISVDWKQLDTVVKQLSKNKITRKVASSKVRDLLGADVYKEMITEYGNGVEDEMNATEKLILRIQNMRKAGYVSLTRELSAKIKEVARITGRTVKSVGCDFGVYMELTESEVV